MDIFGINPKLDRDRKKITTRRKREKRKIHQKIRKEKNSEGNENQKSK